jgi:hypothetical protein
MQIKTYRCIPPEKMSVSPHRLQNDFFVLINNIKTSGVNYLNVLDLLNENEKRIFTVMLKGLTMSQVADTYRCTTDEVNNVRLQIIDKFEKSAW